MRKKREEQPLEPSKETGAQAEVMNTSLSFVQILAVSILLHLHYSVMLCIVITEAFGATLTI